MAGRSRRATSHLSMAIGLRRPGSRVRHSGTIIRSRYRSISLSGVYELRVGLYRLADFARLPVQGPEGRVADSAIILGQWG